MYQPPKRKVNPRFRLKGFNHPVVKVLILLNIIFWSIALYIYFKRDSNQTHGQAIQYPTDSLSNSTSKVTEVPINEEIALPDNLPEEKEIETIAQKKTNVVSHEDSVVASTTLNNQRTLSAQEPSTVTRDVVYTYTVAAGIAHFHNAPDANTQRKAFINHWNNAVLHPIEERNGFIYIVYKNEKGQVSKGWLDKKDLKQIN